MRQQKCTILKEILPEIMAFDNTQACPSLCECKGDLVLCSFFSGCCWYCYYIAYSLMGDIIDAILFFIQGQHPNYGSAHNKSDVPLDGKKFGRNLKKKRKSKTKNLIFDLLNLFFCICQRVEVD